MTRRPSPQLRPRISPHSSLQTSSQTITHASRIQRALVGAALLLTGCGSLIPPASAPATVYRLDGAALQANAAARPAAAALPTAPSLIVQPTRAAAGFDSRHIVYSLAPQQIAHFAHSDWADTPARMLDPMIVASLEASGRFGAVGTVASGLAGELRLDTELLQLLQDFSVRPSQVRVTLRAVLMDGATGKLIASRGIEVSTAAASDDPAGGVLAANTAVRAVLRQLADFCGEAVGRAALAP